MAPLEQLFRLEIEFRRRLREDVGGPADISSLHTSYALSSDYDRLIGSVGSVGVPDVQKPSQQFLLTSDLPDVVSARESLIRILGLKKDLPG